LTRRILYQLPQILYSKLSFLDFPLTIGCDTFWRILSHFFYSSQPVCGSICDNWRYRDVWCNSKKPINDSSMYRDFTLNDPFYAIEPSIYALYFQAQPPTMYLTGVSGNYILPSAPNFSIFFLCEWYGVFLCVVKRKRKMRLMG
jgi:hypothetical protein